jgi:hypothetical protein
VTPINSKVLSMVLVDVVGLVPDHCIMMGGHQRESSVFLCCGGRFTELILIATSETSRI